MVRFPIALALLALSSADAHAGVAGILGQTTDCDYATIQEAIDDAGTDDVIYIHTGTMLFTPPAMLNIEESITLAAGNSSCDGPNTSQRAIIDASGHGGRTMRISGTSGADISVDLQNLELHDGSVTYNGGNLLGRYASLQLDGVYIYGGSANNGANVHLHHATLTMNGGCLRNGVAASMGGGLSAWNNGSGSDTIALNSVDVANNAAGTHGGGLRVEGNGYYLVRGESTIFDNHAVQDGGGIYAKGHVDIQGGQSVELSDHVLTVRNNVADRNGGGLFLEPNHATAGMHLYQLDVDSNDAVNGGGFYVDDDQPVEIEHTMVSGNAASNLGGGMFVGSAADVFMEEGTHDPDLLLSEFVKNTADSGAGIYVEKGTLDLDSVSFRDQTLHAPGSDLGLDLHLTWSSTADLFKVLAVTSDPQEVTPSMLAEGTSVLTIDYATVINPARYGIRFEDDADGTFDNSIFDGSEISFGAAHAYSAQCSLIIEGYDVASSSGSVDDTGSLVGTGYTPDFTGDYELDVNSDALGLACGGAGPDAGAR